MKTLFHYTLEHSIPLTIKSKRMRRTLLAALTLLLALPSWLATSAQTTAPEKAGPIDKRLSVKEVMAPSTVADIMADEQEATQQEAPTENANAFKAKQPTTSMLKVAKQMGSNFSAQKAPAGPRRAEAVTLPSGLTPEEWVISTNFYANSYGFVAFRSTVQVAIDGDDIYVAGFSYWLRNAWVKGTLSNNIATFPSGQYYGQDDGDDLWFVGFYNGVCDVTFTYNPDTHRLTLDDDIAILEGSDTEGSYYAYHINTVLTQPESETVADGSTSNEYVPVYGWYFETSNMESQMIYPASYFQGLTPGTQISSITFYVDGTNTVPAKLGNSTVQVYINETTATTITSDTEMATNRNGATLVYQSKLPTGGSSMTINFNSPYTYQGGNLIIGTINYTPGTSYDHCYWKGENRSNASYYKRSSSDLGSQNFLPKMTLDYAYPLPTRVIDFGNVEVGQSKTITANIDQRGSTGTASTDESHFTTGSLQFSNKNSSVPVTFTPTAAMSYTSTLSVTIDGHTTNITLKGVGNISGAPEALRDSTFFSGIAYNWTDSTGVGHTSTLNEIATDPDQMIAMLRKVYMDKSIPGNFKRGYSNSLGTEDHDDVYYGGVGDVAHSGSSYSSAENYSYNDGYGWNIPGDVTFETKSVKYYNSSYSSNYYTTNAYYAYMDPTQYKPTNEGLTLLLVEMTDDFNNKTAPTSTTSYATLRSYFANSFKSVRLITSAKRTGTGESRGTMFKIDCDKMNKFFLLAKGQMRFSHNSYIADSYKTFTYNGSTYHYSLYDENCPYPTYIYNPVYFDYVSNRFRIDTSTPTNGYIDEFSREPFYHMFEQFSPVASDATVAKGDIYQDLVDMQSFGVEHDCMSISLKGHQFMMYGDDSEAADCADVRDLMFFVPDYRMKYYRILQSNDTLARDNELDEWKDYQKFLNYNLEHQPTMGLYVIRQDSIKDTRHDDDHYMLTLTWDSNLDDFLPTDQQYYELLQVVTDENGNETYVPVYYRNDAGLYTDSLGNVLSDQSNPVPIKLTLGQNDDKVYTQVYVEREQSSKQVTYVIRGCDKGNFLSLKASNKQSYIIPGKDPAEMLALLDRSHYSRYNPQNQTNCYSNMVQLTNTPTGLKHSAVQDGLIMELFRDYGTGENIVSARVAKIVVTDKNTRQFTVTMENQNVIADFPAGKKSGIGAGYHKNHNTDGNASWTDTYRVLSNDVISLDRLIMYDNFVVDVSENTHPALYTYRVVTTYTDNTLQQGQTAYSNTFLVPVFKTQSRINDVFTKAQVDADTSYPEVGNLPSVEFGAQVRYSSKTEILRYDAYRWNEGETRYIIDEVGETDNDEEDLPPTGMAGNQDGSYSVSMNDVENQPEYYTTSTVTVAPGETDKWANFVDKYADDKPGAYVYAPVIETFASGKDADGNDRRDYNTYGGPLQKTATGRIDVTVNDTQQGGYNFYKNGVAYCYYTMSLDWKTIANSLPLIPNGYDIYKIRAWRKIDRKYMGEQLSDRESRMGNDNGEYLFEEFTYPDVSKSTQGTPPALGSTAVGENNEKTGTFGAIDVNAQGAPYTEIPVTFVVRLYFTSEAELSTLPSNLQGAPRRAGETGTAEDKYYIYEMEIPTTLVGGSDQIITAVNDLNYREVEQVLYYNPTGMVSDRPFDGVNVVVTRYTDGSTSTKKVVK